MQLINFYHGHHLHRLAKHPDFNRFELAIWLHTLAHSLISIFVPILLLKTGYTITDILIFYLAYNAIDVPLNFAVDSLVRRIGARIVIIMGSLAAIGFFVVLGILPPDNLPFMLVLAFLAAAYDTLFWIGHIYIFIEATREGLDTGKSVGALTVVRQLAGIAGPLMGAILLIVFGKGSLVVTSVTIFALSIIPLYKMRHVRDVPSQKRTPLRKFLSDRHEKRDFGSMALWGIHKEVDGVLWPLFIFTVFGTIGSVAAVPVIVSIASASFSYWAGKLTKKFGTKMMIVGCVIVAASWIFRLTIQSPTLYYVTIFLVGIFSLLVAIPLDVNIASRALKADSLTAATYRNTTSMSSRIPFYIFLLLWVEVFKFSFASAALCSLLIIFVITSLNLRQKAKV